MSMYVILLKELVKNILLGKEKCEDRGGDLEAQRVVHLNCSKLL